MIDKCIIKYFSLTNLSLVVLVICTLFLCVSCSDLDDFKSEISQEDNYNVEFILKVPGYLSPMTTTRSMGVKEHEVKELDLLLFDKDDKFQDRITILTNEIDQVGQIVKTHVNVKRENYRFVLVANASSVVNSITMPQGEDKVTILEQFEYSYTSKWASDGNGTYQNIPMYAESSVIDMGAASGSSSNRILNVNLIRMLARIDVNVSASNFTLKEVYLCNYNTNGYIAPSWSKPPLSPNLPITLHPKKGASNALLYKVSNLSLSETIYTFESLSTSDDNGIEDENRKGATCLVVKGVYNNRDYYYRIDFTYDGTSGSVTGNYMPLLRNYKYVVDIKTASGIGYTSLEEALDSYTITSNLKTRIITYNEGEVKDVSYNGQYMLGFSDDSYLITPSSSTTQQIKVFTDYDYGWTYTSILDKDGNPISWLRLSQTSGLKGTTSLDIDVDPIPVEYIARVGYITLTAGRLQANIEIIQTAYELQEPSNCYLIKPNATSPLLIPISRAEEGNPGCLQRRNDFSGDMVWTDNMNGLDIAGTVKDIKTVGEGRKAIIVVSAGEAKGNAVVSIADKDDQKIKWSWHIWTTDYDLLAETGLFMDRDLGAINNGTEGYQDWWWDSRGLFYQWGRKDPFPNIYEKQYPPAVPTVRTQAYGYDKNGVRFDLIDGSFNDLITSIENPVTYSYSAFASQMWNGSDNNNSWSINGKKSVYDPSPVGWRVPTSLDVFDQTLFLSNSYIWKLSTDQTVSYKDYNYTAGRVSPGQGRFYSGSGGLFYGVNSLRVVINDVADIGYFWTAQANPTSKHAYVFKITEGTIKDTPLTSLRDRGFSIRCVRDN